MKDINSDAEYSEYIKWCTLTALQNIKDSIDRESYPKRYQMVPNEISERPPQDNEPKPSSNTKIPAWTWIALVVGILFLNVIRACVRITKTETKIIPAQTITDGQNTHIIFNSTDLTPDELAEVLELGASTNLTEFHIK